MAEAKVIPIQTLHLFPVLDKLLIQLLQSLSSAEWHAPTLAKLWTVKDIASHLLDGNLKVLSTSRDHYWSKQTAELNSYNDIVAYINQSNLAWTNATQHLSPAVLIQLLEITGQEYSKHLLTLDPFQSAIYPVAWAGDEVSDNWFHIAREYTEKFHHQQQIRTAVGREGIMTRELFYPFIQTLMLALPFAYRKVNASTGTLLLVNITTGMGGQWWLEKREIGWALTNETNASPETVMTIQPQDAWQLFTRKEKPDSLLQRVRIEGNVTLASPLLQMTAVMA